MKKYNFSCSVFLVLIISLLNTSIFASTLSNKNQSFEATSLIKSDGSYWVWGNNQVAPLQIHGVENVEQSFSNQFIMKRDKSVFYWDKDELSGVYEVHKVNRLNNLIDLQSAWNDLLALDQEGTVHYLSKAGGMNYHLLDKIKPLAYIDNVIGITNYYENQNYNPQVRWGFLKNDGSVWINVAEFPLEDFKPILLLENIIDIDQNIALKKDGTVWTWSDRTIESNQDISAKPISELRNIQSIKSFGTGKTNIAIDRDDSLWFWGGTFTGYSDGTTINFQPKPVKLTSIQGG